MKYLLFALIALAALPCRADFKIKAGENLVIANRTGDSPVVKTALRLFADDYKTVFGGNATLSGEEPNIVVAVTAGNFMGVSLGYLKGRHEAFVMAVTSNGQLLIAGSDAHGAAYGVMELSRMIGVSPWTWWADVTPEHRQSFQLDNGFMKKEAPSVAYRGLFINDEDWGLLPWSYKNYEKSDISQVGPKTYTRVFELLLRLRANTCWPAMHECTLPFFMTEGNREAAKACGIYIGTSHCEPMACNAAGEWRRRGQGDYNYQTNREAVKNFWETRVKEVADQEIIYTLGMRGVHDSGMQGAKTVGEQRALTTQVIADQREMLRTHVNSDVTAIPQVLIPYKEVLQTYLSGLQVPDDVTLVWPDDNYGYMRHFPTPAERARSGGNGVYYHLSYWGTPHDFLWLGTISPYLVYQQLHEAYQRGVQKMWIINVGDIKPAEYQLELTMDMAWNMEAVEREGVTKHLENWLCREFGQAAGHRLLPVMQEHYRLCHIRKPEFMAGTMNYSGNDWEIARDLPFTDAELSQRLETYKKLSAEVESIEDEITDGRSDAYEQLVRYPVMASDQMSRKWLYAQQARHGKASWDKSAAAFHRIEALTEEYNNVAGGKWRGMMDFQPRKQPAFMMPDAEHPGKICAPTSVPMKTFNAKEASAGSLILHEQLGYEGGAATIKKGSSAAFDFGEWKGDSITIAVCMLPTQPIEGDRLRYSLTLDNGAPTIVEYQTEEWSAPWKQNILRNQDIHTFTLPIEAKAKHRIKVKAIDEGVILDQVKLF